MACPYAGKTGTTNGVPNHLLCNKWHFRHGFMLWQSMCVKKLLNPASFRNDWLYNRRRDTIVLMIGAYLRTLETFVMGFVLLLPFAIIGEGCVLSFSNLRFDRRLL